MSCVQVVEEVPDPPAGTSESIGIDVGVSRLAQCSDGRVVENPKALRSELKLLKRLHRRLSRTTKGSKNRTKARMKLARKYARIAHVRQDALHQGTSALTRAHLSLEERAARKAEIAASLPEPRTKVKAGKGKRSRPVDPPPLPESIARQVKEKQAKRLFRLAQISDAPLRPAVAVLEEQSAGWHEAQPQAGSFHQRCGPWRVSTTNGVQDLLAGRNITPG